MLAFQAVFILAAGAFLFDIRWGNLWGVAAIVLLFMIVSVSVAVIVGCRSRSSEDAPFARIGIVAMLGLLGGCFFSLELVPAWMRVVGHATPQAWAVDAFEELVGTNAGVGAVAVPLFVLAGLSVVLFGLAERRLGQTVED